MGSTLSNFDIGKDFWALEPQFKIIEPFSSLYKADKSKKKTNSSLIMWAIALFSDKDSKLAKLSVDEKENIIKNDYLKDIKDFNWEEYGEFIEVYYKLHTSQVQRSLIDFEVKLQERDKFLKKTKYNLENAKDLDTIMANTSKLFDLYEKLLERIEEESAEGITKGGRKESASERKEM